MLPDGMTHTARIWRRICGAISEVAVSGSWIMGLGVKMAIQQVSKALPVQDSL